MTARRLAELELLGFAVMLRFPFMWRFVTSYLHLQLIIIGTYMVVAYRPTEQILSHSSKAQVSLSPVPQTPIRTLFLRSGVWGTRIHLIGSECKYSPLILCLRGDIIEWYLL